MLNSLLFEITKEFPNQKRSDAKSVWYCFTVIYVCVGTNRGQNLAFFYKMLFCDVICFVCKTCTYQG